MIQLTEQQIGNFWKKVAKKGADECWEWTGSIQSNGYGQFGNNNKSPMLPHRVAFTLMSGPIPHGICVLHKCDNRKCCNPAHLFLGTHQDNSNDCIAKGRISRGEKQSRAVRENCRRGEDRPESKLTAEQVLEIRRIHASGEMGGHQIGRKFGIAFQHVSKIVNRKQWTHI